MAKFDERVFGDEPQAYDIANLVEEGETILWQGKPNRKAFMLANIFKMLPIALLWLLFDGGMIAMITINGFWSKMPTPIVIFIGVFFLLHLLPVWLWLSNVVTASTRQKNMEYVFTSKRIILKSGVIGIDIANIYYTDIQSVNLKVGITDKMFGVGDIYISGVGKAQVLWDVSNPYPLVAKLQQIVNDIKTDTYYPNDLRPSTNSGYQTQYKPE